jgi:hypothetical protein
MMRTRGATKAYAPERGMQYYLVPGNANSRECPMLPSNHVLSSRMKTSSHDGQKSGQIDPKRKELLRRREAPLETRTDLTPEATKDISGAMNAILADVACSLRENEKFSLAHAAGITSAIITCFSMNTPSNSSP